MRNKRTRSGWVLLGTSLVGTVDTGILNAAAEGNKNLDENAGKLSKDTLSNTQKTNSNQQPSNVMLTMALFCILITICICVLIYLIIMVIKETKEEKMERLEIIVDKLLSKSSFIPDRLNKLANKEQDSEEKTKLRELAYNLEEKIFELQNLRAINNNIEDLLDDCSLVPDRLYALAEIEQLTEMKDKLQDLAADFRKNLLDLQSLHTEINDITNLLNLSCYFVPGKLKELAKAEQDSEQKTELQKLTKNLVKNIFKLKKLYSEIKKKCDIYLQQLDDQCKATRQMLLKAKKIEKKYYNEGKELEILSDELYGNMMMKC